MKKQGTKITGINDLDTPQMTAMRAAVIEQELSARSWKAYYEKMYYSIESEKLEEPYKEFQVRAKARAEEDRKKMEKFMETLQGEISNVNQEDPKGEVKLEEVDAPKNPLTIAK